jgi:hypothetical protein
MKGKDERHIPSLDPLQQNCSKQRVLLPSGATIVHLRYRFDKIG